MKHLFLCMKAYRKQALLAPLFKLLEAGMELLVPLVVAAIVNNGIGAEGGADRAYILYGCLVLVAFGLAGLGFALTAQYFAAKAAVGVSAELRTRLFCRLQSASFSEIDRIGTDTMITRMTSDVNQVQTGVNMTLRLLLRSPLVVFGAMIMAFTVDARAALIFVALIPALAAVVAAVMAVTVPLYRRVQGGLDRVNLSVRENLQGARVLRAFCMEERERETFDSRNGALRAEQKRAGRISALANPLTYALVSLATVALLYVGALRVEEGARLQGDVIALYSYLSLILIELVKLANLIFTVSKAVSCQKRISAALDTKEETDAPSCSPLKPAEGGASLEFENVSFTYEGGGAPALRNVSFRIGGGETLGVLGGTGAGKSTLAHLIPRFYGATEGRVLFDGTDVTELPAAQLRERVGIVLQHSALFCGTIRSNLLWGRRDATDGELIQAAAAAQADDVLAAKGGLDGEIAQGGRNLSGGQRQRLCIARALVKQPALLILDDSSSALDYATDARLRQSVSALPCTKIVVSQRATSVMHADKILVLDEGRVAGYGTHGELMERCALYREIYEIQTEAHA